MSMNHDVGFISCSSQRWSQHGRPWVQSHVLYWDNMCWAEFDARAAVQVGDAIKFTCVYLQGVGYDIDLVKMEPTERSPAIEVPLKYH